MTDDHQDQPQASQPDAPGPRVDGELVSDQRDQVSRSWWSYLTWLLSSLLILPVRGYQQFISPLFGPTCRFDPTCSEYFIQAVRKYGPLRGAWRGVCRIARCHPFHPGGHDPP